MGRRKGEIGTMCRRIISTLLVGAVGLAVLGWSGAWSYVKTGYQTASETVQDRVPIEWEIKRARQMIEDIRPEIAKNLELVAREEVAVERLAKEVAKKEDLLARSREEILQLKNDLQSGSVRFVYAGRSYSRDQVQEDLANRFKQFKVHEQTTAKLHQILTARQKNLDAARRKLDEMLAAKRELEVEVENLQARLTMVQVAHTSNPVVLDDGQLSRTRTLLDDIRTRIDVAERTVAAEGALDGFIPVGESDPPELLDEITRYFGGEQGGVETLVSSEGL
ncbi:MAG: hypothetical protein KatS3mg111_3679 [Pirellulaceae bacterium]|nr:MAG: hypothetical protein KatS3mg111_3679 [Pirellulaceae bacterium]